MVTQAMIATLFDLLEEYLEHGQGHANVLREAVDGLRGNDPD